MHYKCWRTELAIICFIGHLHAERSWAKSIYSHRIEQPFTVEIFLPDRWYLPHATCLPFWMSVCEFVRLSVTFFIPFGGFTVDSACFVAICVLASSSSWKCCGTCFHLQISIWFADSSFPLSICPSLSLSLPSVQTIIIIKANFLEKLRRQSPRFSFNSCVRPEDVLIICPWRTFRPGLPWVICRPPLASPLATCDICRHICCASHTQLPFGFYLFVCLLLTAI